MEEVIGMAMHRVWVDDPFSIFTSDLQLRKLFTIRASIPKRDSGQSTILVSQWRSGISSKPIYIQTTLTRKSDDRIELKTIQVCYDTKSTI